MPFLCVCDFRQIVEQWRPPTSRSHFQFFRLKHVVPFAVCDLRQTDRQTAKQWRPPTSLSSSFLDLNRLCLFLCVTSDRQTHSGTMEATHLSFSLPFLKFFFRLKPVVPFSVCDLRHTHSGTMEATHLSFSLAFF